MEDFRELKIRNTAERVSANQSSIFAAIVECSEAAIISKDHDGLVTSWNAAAQRIFGFIPSEMIGRPIWDIVPEDRRADEELILKQVIEGNRMQSFETRRLKRDGQEIEITLFMAPLRNEYGELIGISEIARDMSRLKRAEEKSAILAAIVNSTDDAVISKNLDGIITSWNISAERIFGYEASEIIGHSILKLIPEDRKEEEPLILNKLRNGNRVDHFETKRMTKSGRLIDVSLTISPVKDEQGKIIGLSKIARDITEKKLEEQRKNDFIAIVSHELKTPLTSVRSYIQLALIKARKVADEYTEKMLIRAEAQTTKMTTLIRDFLDLARLDEGKMTLHRDVFPISSLLQEVVDETRELSPGHVICFVGCEELKVFADRDKISQVLINLLTNAIKYSASGSRIDLSCQEIDDEIRISISDQGLGISKADQQRLFERFYRVASEDLNHISGFGIGLYLVAEILKMHNTFIVLESESGKGSTFSFKLPIVNDLSFN